MNTGVVTHTGSADVHRTTTREALYRVTLEADTVHVSADSLLLSETVDTRQRTFNTDGFVGGSWALLLDANGKATVESTPFVPLDLIDVSNLALAMDDFFPPMPPVVREHMESTDAAGRHWVRDGDSAGVQRYDWTAKRTTTRSNAATGAAGESVQEDVAEASSLVWDPARGPLAWRRHLVVGVTTKVGGRALQAEVDQRIVVMRVH